MTNWSVFLDMQGVKHTQLAAGSPHFHTLFLSEALIIDYRETNHGSFVHVQQVDFVQHVAPAVDFRQLSDPSQGTETHVFRNKGPITQD